MDIFVMDKDVDVNKIKKSKNCYIIAKNGNFFKDRSKYLESVVEIQSISNLDSIQPYIKWKYPKITAEMFYMVYSFFKNVNDQHGTECMVLIGWNTKEKRIEIFPPDKQLVTGASINYEMTKRKNIQLIGSIHSHANMSAFHSSTDIEDEIGFDGLHITLGKLGNNTKYFKNIKDEDDNSFDFSAQLTSNEFRQTIDVDDIIVGINRKYDCMIKLQDILSTNNKDIIDMIKTENCDIKYTPTLTPPDVEVTNEMGDIVETWYDTLQLANKPLTNIVSPLDKKFEAYKYGGFVKNGFTTYNEKNKNVERIVNAETHNDLHGNKQEEYSYDDELYDGFCENDFLCDGQDVTLEEINCHNSIKSKGKQ